MPEICDIPAACRDGQYIAIGVGGLGFDSRAR